MDKLIKLIEQIRKINRKINEKLTYFINLKQIQFIINLLIKRKIYLIVLSLIFIFYNSSNLYRKRNKVVFETNYLIDQELPIISACFPINSSSYNCSELLIDKINHNNSIVDHSKFFDSCIKLKELFIYIEDNRINKSAFDILNRFEEIGLHDLIGIKINNEHYGYHYVLSYLNYNHICVQYKFQCSDCERDFIRPQKSIIYNNYYLTYTLFIHNEKYPISFATYLVRQNCHQFFNCTNYYIYIEKYQFNFLPSPYSTKCLNYFNDFDYDFKSYDRVKTRSGCLNICWKMRYKTTFFFYTRHEKTNLIYSNELSGDEYQNSEYFSDCFEKCKYWDCTSQRFFLKSSFIQQESSNVIEFELEVSFMILDGKAYIGKFELYLNIISLLGLVLGFDILSFIIKTSKYLRIKLNLILKNLLNDNLINRLIFIISWYIMILLFILSIYQSNMLARDYLKKRYKNYYKIIYPGFQPFNVHICLPLAHMINDINFKLDHFNETDLNRIEIENKLLKNYLIDKNLSFLIKNTYNLTQVLSRIYYSFGLKRKPIDFKDNILDSFFRKHILWNREQTDIYVKCFTIKLELEMNGYENLFTSARLVMKFKFEKVYFYLTEIDNTISSSTQPLLEHREVVKRIRKIRSDCLDYSKLSCNSKSNCFDECTFETILQKKERLTLNYLNLKEDYRKYLKYSFYLKSINKDKIMNCHQKYKLKDCNQVFFDWEKTHWHISGVKNTKIIQIVFRNIFETEVEIKKNWDLFFNLLNLYSVLLGINIQNLMILILKLFELKIDLNNFRIKSKKIFKILFFILFILSVYYTCKITFKDEKNTSLLILNSPDMHLFPEINICFDYEIPEINNFNQTKFTGRDLDNLTDHITFDKVFEYFIILDNTNIEITLRPPYENQTKLFLNHFYFLNKKCLRIRYDFNFIFDKITNYKYPIRFKFNQSTGFFYYYYCSNFVKHNTLSTLNRLSYKESYEIYLDKVKFSYNDIFEEFKNPLLFFKSIRYLDLEIFIDKLSDDIVDTINHTTRWMPLNDRKYFDHYINDTLFEIYFNKFKQREQSFFSQNFKYKFLKDRIFRNSKTDDYNLKFNKEYLYTESELESNESFLSFIVNVLNCFSFFLSMSMSKVMSYSISFLINFMYKVKHCKLI